MKRNDFLAEIGKRLLALVAAGMAGPGFLRLAAAGGVARAGADVLVTIFLRGACDGLSIVPPISGSDRDAYEAARPNLKIPVSGARSALKLDERFGLHPAADPLYELYRERKLAIVHAAGLPSNTRSHFDAQNYMDLGTPDKKGTPSGWLTRYLEAGAKGAARSPAVLGAVMVGNLLPLSLLGCPEAAVLDGVGGFELAGNRNLQAQQRKALRGMYAGSGWIDRAGMQALDTMDLLDGARGGEYRPGGGADYPRCEIGNRLKTLAQLLKMGLGIRVATLDMGGWDTHRFQGNGPEGPLANLLGQLSQALRAFYLDMGRAKGMTIVVMSEFGRRLKENANRGTDHGHGNIMLVLGDRVRGGKVYGQWPGLRNDELYERADLAVTTDYRQVLGEVLARRLGAPRIDAVFPGFSGYKPLGLIGA